MALEQAGRPTFSHDSGCTRTGFGSSSSGQALISPGAGRRFPAGHYRRPDFQVVRVASWALGLGDVQLLCDDGLLVWSGLGRSDEMLKATAVRNAENDQGEEMARSRPVASGQGRHRPFSLDPHFTPPLQWLAPRAWIGDLCHGVSELAADGRPFSRLLPCPSSFLLPPRTAGRGRRHDSVSNATGPQPVAILTLVQLDWTGRGKEAHPASGHDWTMFETVGCTLEEGSGSAWGAGLGLAIGWRWHGVGAFRASKLFHVGLTKQRRPARPALGG